VFGVETIHLDLPPLVGALSRRLHGYVLTRLYPQPDLVVLLDAPPEVLFARKGEGTIGSLGRRRAEYMQLGATLERFAVVDATLPLPVVIRDVAAIVRGHEERR